MEATTPKRLDAPTFPPRVTLKNIKIHHGLSEETYAYTASVYVDGKRVGEVKNDGHGGPDFLYVQEAAAYDAVKAAQKEHDPSPYGEDVLFGDMLTEHLMQQDARKMLRKGYQFAVLADKRILYGFHAHEAERIPEVMAGYNVAEYRVFEA